MSRTSMYLKMAGVFVACGLGGPALMYYVTPSEGELFKRFSPELQASNLANRERRMAEYEHFVKNLKEYSKSDKPIWEAAAEAQAKLREEARQKQVDDELPAPTPLVTTPNTSRSHTLLEVASLHPTPWLLPEFNNLPSWTCHGNFASKSIPTYCKLVGQYEPQAKYPAWFREGHYYIFGAVHPQILATCKQVQSEATNWLYRNPLCSADLRSMKSFLERVGGERVALITHALLLFRMDHVLTGEFKACFTLAPNLVLWRLMAEYTSGGLFTCNMWRCYQLVDTVLRNHPSLRIAAFPCHHGILGMPLSSPTSIHDVVLQGPDSSPDTSERIIDLEVSIDRTKSDCALRHAPYGYQSRGRRLREEKYPAKQSRKRKRGADTTDVDENSMLALESTLPDKAE